MTTKTKSRALETRGEHDAEEWDGTFQLAGDPVAATASHEEVSS